MGMEPRQGFLVASLWVDTAVTSPLAPRAGRGRPWVRLPAIPSFRRFVVHGVFRMPWRPFWPCTCVEPAAGAAPRPAAAMGAVRGAAGRAACPQRAAAAPRARRRPPSPRPTPAVRIARVPVSCPPSPVRPRDDPPPSSLCRRPVKRTPISQPATGRRLRGRVELRRPARHHPRSPSGGVVVTASSS